MAKRPNKFRAQFRKNRSDRSREKDWTRVFQADQEAPADAVSKERISGKGELTRKRTIRGAQVTADSTGGFDVLLDVDETACRRGRVISVYGRISTVMADDATPVECTTRRLLKTIATDQRHVVVAGDEVLFRPVDEREGVIERVEPRHGLLCRASRGRRHIIVANVDQVLIVASAAEPGIKPHLIDRLIVSAEQAGIEPIICINKIDLVDSARLAPLVGVYGRMGYRVLMLSATSGFGVERLRQQLAGRQTAVAGQSGVGKSSLLNAVEPRLALRVGAVSAENEKGRHTTTTARLLQLGFGGYVVDTPGVRQFELWDLVPEEVAGYFRDLRPLVSHCRFPNCTHTHEDACAVKDAVADGWLDTRRYESYCHLFSGDSA